MSFEYLKKKYPHLRQQINTYKEPDEFVYVNCQWEQNGETYTPVDDPNLQTIKINIQDLIERNAKFWSPENPPKGISKPKLDKIAGFGKFATDQYFEVPEPPDSLVDLEKNYFNYRHKPKDDDPEVVEYFWQVIYSNPTKYKDALDYIEKALYHIRYGYWFYNDGKPTYIDGWHYRHLCFWKQGTLETRDKKTGKKRKQDTPEFRERGQKSFFFYKWCMVDTTDSTGKDYGIRTCFGYVMPKTRRVGETANILTPALDISSMQNTYSSFAADSERTSRDIFKKKFIVAWDKQPPWLRPMNDSVRPVNFLNNSKPARKKRIFRDYLDSYVDYADKADRSFYDGAEVNGLALNDEGAKCFKKDTPIRMFDGSIKLIQNLVKGDELMGPDGLKRTVRVTTSGQEEMFDVLPKKQAFEPWGCNKSHILSLKVSCKTAGPLNSIVNMTVEEYLNLFPSNKKKYCLWKSQVDYPERKTTIDPYFLGIWLGDGNKSNAGLTLHNKDVEVLDYVKKYVYTLGLEVSTTYNSTNSVKVYISKKVKNNKPNFIIDKLREYSLNVEKEIPEDYRINSRQNRLQILAGIIDSDGHLSKKGNKCRFAITMKSEKFAQQVKLLADGLGFSASKKAFIAKLKGKEFTSNKVTIYGDNLEDIPTKLPRKQAPKRIKSARGKDPHKAGFTLESKGVGTYYGVTIDGPDRLFMLQDYQVVHNTTATNILEGWSLMKPCMAPGGNTAIRKFALAAFPSTVEEMEAGGGDNFWKLCQQSNYYETSDMTGQTDSGLRLVFFPSYEGLEGFIDKHGRSVVENPTEEQAKFIGKDYGAKTYIERTIEALKNKKTIEASEELKSFKRKHPVMYFDCWTFKGENSGLDKEIMSNRIVELELKKEPVRKGNLFWKVKEAGGGSKLYNAEDYLNTFGKHDNPLTHEAKVVFKDDQYGRFEMSEIPYPHESNLKQRINDVWQCTSPLRIASADTFDFLTEGQFKKVDRDNTTKMSRGAGAVMLCQDRQKDKDTKDTTEWTSYKFVCDYLYRTKSSDIYCEEMLMMSIYWSCVMYPEINKPLVWQHFVDRGYGGFLLYEVDLKSGMLKDKPGFRTGTESKQDLFDGVRNYVSAHLHKEEQLRIIKDFQAIKGYDDMTNRDLFTAAAGCIRGHKHMQYQIPDKEESTSSIADYF